MLSELKKSVFNINFLICCIIVFLLCFSSEVYRDRNNDMSYSVIDVLLMFNNERIISDNRFNFSYIFSNGAGSYLCMFLPIISSFPFVSAFCAERNCGLIRFVVQRISNRKYYFYKFMSCIFSGGLVACLGYIMFGFVIAFVFPISDTSFYDIICPIGGFLLYGAFSTMPAFVLSSFVYNRYIITCIPFILVYAINISFAKTGSFFREQYNIELYNVVGFLLPDSIRYLFHFSNNWHITLVFNIIIYIFAYTIYALIMNRRCDLGE